MSISLIESKYYNLNLIYKMSSYKNLFQVCLKFLVQLLNLNLNMQVFYNCIDIIVILYIYFFFDLLEVVVFQYKIFYIILNYKKSS